MKLKSSQRWAIGAIVLTALIACSPPAPVEPAQPTPQPPVLSGTTTPALGPPPASIDPGFKGAWASLDSNCDDPASTIRMSGTAINLMAGEGDCTIANIEEEHPTGRSMIYRIAATCTDDDQTREDRFRLDFGPSDTVIQMTVNDREPVRLIRCPPLTQP